MDFTNMTWYSFNSTGTINRMATDNRNMMSFNADNISQVLSLFGQLPSDKKQLLLRMLGLNQERDVFALLDDSQTLFAYPEYRLHKILLLYVSPLLLVLGTFGNIFSVFIMRQRSMIRMSAYVYLIHLAVADSMVLYIGLLRLWISELTGMDIRNQTAWLCKLVIFSGYVSSNLSVWLIIAVTVERYIVVCHPLKVNKFCTVPRAKRVVLGLLVLFILIHAHFFWTVTLNQLDLNGVDKHYCGSRKNFHYLVSVAWPWIDAIFYSFLPFVAILFFNTLIIRRIIILSRGAMKMQSAQSNLLQVYRIGDDVISEQVRRCHNDSSRKLTLMLLTLSFTLLLTTLPLPVSLILAHFWNDKATRDFDSAAKYQLTKTIAELMMYLNHSMNFILYCAMGQKFRHQIVRMFCNRHNTMQGLADHTHHIYCSRYCSAQGNVSNQKQCSDTGV